MSLAMGTATPKVVITDQIFYQRFRYGTEKRAAKKHRDGIFMKIQLSNIPPDSTLKIFCVKSKEEWQYPHPNRLSGQDCVAGVYCPSNKYSGNQEISIPWLQINRIKKEDMEEILKKQSALLPQEFSDGCNAVRAYLQAGKKLGTNQVCVCVHVTGTLDNGEQYSVYDLSTDIMNEDKVTQLKIDEMSVVSACVYQPNQIINHIFTREDSPSIEPDMIDLHMEETDSAGNVTWTSDSFVARKGDIKYKHVIRYPVPPYRNLNIAEPVRVKLVIRCLRTQEEDRMDFTYQPSPEVACFSRKRNAPSVKEKYAHLDISPNKIQKTGPSEAGGPAGSRVIQSLREKMTSRNGRIPGLATNPTMISQSSTSSQMVCGVRGQTILPRLEHQTMDTSPAPTPAPAPAPATLSLLQNQTDLLETTPSSAPEPPPGIVRVGLQRGRGAGLLYFDPSSVRSSSSEQKSNVEDLLRQTVCESQLGESSMDGSGFLTPAGAHGTNKLTMMAKHLASATAATNVCSESDLVQDTDICTTPTSSDLSDGYQASQDQVVTQQPLQSIIYQRESHTTSCSAHLVKEPEEASSGTVNHPSLQFVAQNGLTPHISSEDGLGNSQIRLQIPESDIVTSPVEIPSPVLTLPSSAMDVLNLDSANLEELILENNFSETQTL